MTEQDDDKEQAPPLTFLQMVQSTLWAVLGVQKRDNRERDFTRGNALHFIYMGIGFTVLFVLIMIGVVNLVMSLAQ